MNLTSKAVLASAVIISASMMSFRTHSAESDMVRGRLVKMNSKIKLAKTANQKETAAEVAAAVAEAADEAALAVYEATPAAAEFAVVAAALLAEAHNEAISNDKPYIEEVIKTKAYQLDQK